MAEHYPRHMSCTGRRAYLVAFGGGGKLSVPVPLQGQALNDSVLQVGPPVKVLPLPVCHRVVASPEEHRNLIQSLAGSGQDDESILMFVYALYCRVISQEVHSSNPSTWGAELAGA